MIIEETSPNSWKSLGEIKDSHRYLLGYDLQLSDRVFCPACGRDYLATKLEIDFRDSPCCPSRSGNVQCDSSLKNIVKVQGEKQLSELRQKAKPQYPFWI